MIHIRETQGIPKSESNSMTPGITHFGAIRGLDQFKDHKAIFIVGEL